MFIKLVKRYFYQNYTNFPLPFLPFSTNYQTGHTVIEIEWYTYILVKLTCGRNEPNREAHNAVDAPIVIIYLHVGQHHSYKCI